MAGCIPFFKMLEITDEGVAISFQCFSDTDNFLGFPFSVLKS